MRTEMLGTRAAALLLAVCAVAAARDGLCARCGRWLHDVAEGTGLDRDWPGLCDACKDPARRCTESIKRLEKLIAFHREYWEYLKKHVEEFERANPGKVDHGGRQEMKFTEDTLAYYLPMLEKMKAECFGTGGCGGGADAAREAAAERVRDLRKLMEELSERMRQLTEQMKGLEAELGGGAGLGTAGAPAEAAYADSLHRVVQPLEASYAPLTAASGGGGEAETAAVSQEARIRPTLLDASKGLPAAPLARALERTRRHAANAAACARALQESRAQVTAALAAGEAQRAARHRERALYLATVGQREERAATAARTEAVRTVQAQREAFEALLEERGVPAEEAFARWQAEVRERGLPPDRVEEIAKAGVSREAITRWTAWLLSLDAGATARLHERFTARLAPRALPRARGAAQDGAPPDAESLWDHASLDLLHEERPGPHPRPEDRGG